MLLIGIILKFGLGNYKPAEDNIFSFKINVSIFNDLIIIRQIIIFF